MKLKHINPETKKLFLETVNYEFQKLKKDESLIFHESNLNYTPNFMELYESWIADKNGYLEYLNTPDAFKKRHIIDYLFENSIAVITNEINASIFKNYSTVLEETGNAYVSLTTDIQVENTIRLILENYIFSDFPKDYKETLVEGILELRREQYNIIEESIDGSTGTSIGKAAIDKLAETRDFLIDNIIGMSRSIKEMFLFLLLVLYSPYLLISSENVKYKIFGMSGLGNLKKTLALIGPCRNLAELLLKGYDEIGAILKDVNEFDKPEIRDLLKEISKSDNTSNIIINDCWTKNARTLPSEEVSEFSFSLKKVAEAIKLGRMQWLGHPSDTGQGLLGWLFTVDASDQSFQKSFFEFRKCIYDHIFDLILGYAKVAVELDIHNTEIIENIKMASRRKDFHFFEKLMGTSDKKELIMYKVGRALLAIDEIAENLKENKRILFQDKYLDQFYIYLKQKIKQTFLDLDEIAEKKSKEEKDSDSKVDEDKYEESWKDHKMSTIRHGKKPKKIKSIYEM